METTATGGSGAVRVRIAPSPTGPFHIGTARTALFNALYARHHGGTYIVRVEDTDAARSTTAFESDILAGLKWLGLEGDEGVTTEGELGELGPYRQSARTTRYGQVASELHERGLAYYCFCTQAQLDEERAAREVAKLPPRYSNRCRAVAPAESARRRAAGEPAALRFRIPEGVIVIDDLVRGRVEISAETLGGDLVIVRADGSPLYHFTVVVDDVDMGITHVIRGEDHLSNTPKHILLFQALGAPLPAFAHLPLILNPDRTKMSKRKSQTALADYRAEGFLQEALINFLALLGWSTGSEDEVLSMTELVERFDLHHVQKAGAVFDRTRLEWLNGQWIRRLTSDDLAARLRPFYDTAATDGRLSRPATNAEIAALIPLIRERIPLLSSAVELTDFLFTDGRAKEVSSLIPKRWDAATTRDALREARPIIAAGIGEADALLLGADDSIEVALRLLAEAHNWKPGDLFMALRVAATGRTATPPLFDSMRLLGRAKVLARLDDAAARLDAV
jgi:glutamyl-tRNA synthetase